TGSSRWASRTWRKLWTCTSASSIAGTSSLAGGGLRGWCMAFQRQRRAGSGRGPHCGQSVRKKASRCAKLKQVLNNIANAILRCPPPRCAPASPPGSEIAPRMPVSLPFRRCALAWLAASALAVPPCGLARQPPQSPGAVELDRLVVVTAARSERLLSDVPIRTEVMRGEDIALRAATDFSRVAELVIGVRVESHCQNCN